MNRVRDALRIVACLALPVVFASVACGGAPSMKPDMPREILSWRDEILSREEYGELVSEWRSYIKRHPKSAVAHVQLARALRYADAAPVEERQELITKALELDPNCPEALDAMADTGLHSKEPLVSLEEAVEYGQRAVELAPDWPYPHFTLWSHLVILGRHHEADEQLRALIEKGGIPSPLLDYNCNVLVSADSDAIIFTNGDNDTYPPLALQTTHGVRPDVTIVNLSLLNRIEYAKSVWKNVPGHKAPFTEKELQTLYDSWKKRREYKTSGTLYASKVMRALLDKVRDGEWTRPVYLAITLSPTNLEQCEQAREVEGLLWRVKRERKSKSEEAEPPVNLEKTRRLFLDDYRLESATDFAFRWTLESAIKPLMRNYPAVLRLLATESAERGDMETVRYALGEAIRILSFHGEAEMVEKMATYWKELDPNNPDVDRWL